MVAWLLLIPIKSYTEFLFYNLLRNNYGVNIKVVNSSIWEGTRRKGWYRVVEGGARLQARVGWGWRECYSFINLKILV